MKARYFTEDELKCKCDKCGHTCAMDRSFLQKLDTIRASYGKPMYPTCGFRCNNHNAEVGGVSGSNHTEGRAVDIYVKDKDFDKLADIARNYLSEVIVYTDRNFIHLGDD